MESFRLLFAAALLLVSASVAAAGPASTPSARDLNQFRGQVVLLDFWASWCGPCRRSFPWMNQLLKTHANAPLTIVAVNLDKNRADADQFLKDFPAAFEVWFDPEGALATHFDVSAMPTSILLDAQGEVITVHRGFRSQHADRYEASITQALRANDGPARPDAANLDTTHLNLTRPEAPARP